jgi:hypothetical protein
MRMKKRKALENIFTGGMPHGLSAHKPQTLMSGG